jgi:hypothetical protein
MINSVVFFASFLRFFFYSSSFSSCDYFFSQYMIVYCSFFFLLSLDLFFLVDKCIIFFGYYVSVFNFQFNVIFCFLSFFFIFLICCDLLADLKHRCSVFRPLLCACLSQASSSHVCSSYLVPSCDANSSTFSEQIKSFFRQECEESDLFAKDE